MDEDMLEIHALLKEIDSLAKYKHITESGICHERIQKLKACQSDDELSKIIHLVDSHVPNLRARAAMRYQRLATSSENVNESQEELQLLRDIIATKCNTGISNAIAVLKSRISELPKEWTVVQITKHYNPMEDQNVDNNKYYTDGLYITLFDCGQSDNDPFLLTVDPPTVNGVKLELCQQLIDILEAHNKLLKSTSKRAKFINRKEKVEYLGHLGHTETTLKDIVNNVEKNWLGVWRCLFIGKFVNESIEQTIRNDMSDILQKQIGTTAKIPQKSIELLYHITKGGYLLTLNEIKSGVQFCLRNFCSVDTIKQIAVLIKELSIHVCNKYPEARKHPVILVVDELLDSFPWERMRVLQDQSVSRVPSFHFVYFLFKVHEASIEDGHKVIVENYENGKFVMNPDGDLEGMASRMLSFYRYWLPKWDGIYNQKPSYDQFRDLLKSADIFAYNGHGNGTHIMTVETLQHFKLKAVVMLFGCASTRISRPGPQVSTYGSYHMFLISRCPCVLGMLWPVTDMHTDLFTAELLTSWIPSEAPIPWSEVDKTNWIKGSTIEMSKQLTAKSKKTYTLELPQALAQCKTKTDHYLTKATCILRGIPVKIKFT